jgi:hypothetical protein
VGCAGQQADNLGCSVGMSSGGDSKHAVSAAQHQCVLVLTGRLPAGWLVIAVEEQQPGSPQCSGLV